MRATLGLDLTRKTPTIKYMALSFEKVSYAISQRLRCGWFLTNHAATMRLSGPMRRPASSAANTFPSVREISSDLSSLISRDWANIEAGLYVAPEQQWPNPIRVLKKAKAYFRDLHKVNQRIVTGNSREVAHLLPNTSLPAYYLHNFHFQTDGYLSEASAELYDYQVEVLFSGGAETMRRQALVPLRAAFCDKNIRDINVLDLACGTGQFMANIKQNYPRLAVSGIDLSAPYLRRAKQNLKHWSRFELVHGNGESLPFSDESFDAVSCIYLFHELPRPVRRNVANEIHRVLKPKGRFIFVDSLQPGDHPPFDSLLAHFPHATHEPFYTDFLNDDLEHLFCSADFKIHSLERAFFSRIMTLIKQ